MQPNSMTNKNDAIDYSGVRGSKKACERGYHAAFEVTQDATFRGETCVVCGRKNMYQLHSVGVSKMLDERTWRKMHAVDFLQPWLPDGTVNPLYVEFYGDPQDLREAKLRLEKEKDLIRKREAEELSGS